MKIIRKKELITLLEHIDDSELKNEIEKIAGEYEEIPTDLFFERIKKLEKINSNDYKLFLLLEEFYLRFKDIEEKYAGRDW